MIGDGIDKPTDAVKAFVRLRDGQPTPTAGDAGPLTEERAGWLSPEDAAMVETWATDGEGLHGALARAYIAQSYKAVRLKARLAEVEGERDDLRERFRRRVQHEDAIKSRLEGEKSAAESRLRAEQEGV